MDRHSILKSSEPIILAQPRASWLGNSECSSKAEQSSMATGWKYSLIDERWGRKHYLEVLWRHGSVELLLRQYTDRHTDHAACNVSSNNRAVQSVRPDCASSWWHVMTAGFYSHSVSDICRMLGRKVRRHARTHARTQYCVHKLIVSHSRCLAASGQSAQTLLTFSPITKARN